MMKSKTNFGTRTVLSKQTLYWNCFNDNFFYLYFNILN
jgi:hypothetical protein